MPRTATGWMLVVSVLLALVASPARAEVTKNFPCLSGGVLGTLTASAFEQITFSTTALSLTAAKLGGATRVVMVKISLETNLIRYRDDGTAPTSTVGEMGNDKDVLYICGPSLGRFQGIRQGAADSVSNVTYYSR